MLQKFKSSSVTNNKGDLPKVHSNGRTNEVKLKLADHTMSRRHMNFQFTPNLVRPAEKQP